MDDFGEAIAVDSAGNAYVAGFTDSDETTFPVKVGPGLIHGGGEDAFVAKVKADGTALAYAGYVGGVGNDFANAIAVDAAGDAYIAGDTASDEKAAIWRYDVETAAFPEDRRRGVEEYVLARFYAGKGRLEEASSRLERALALRPDLREFARQDPELAKLLD